MKLYKTKAAKLAVKRARSRRFDASPARKRAQERWRRRNTQYMRDARALYYERNRAEVLWRSRLSYWLARVVRAEQARGRFE